jgi:hypothetical protein
MKFLLPLLVLSIAPAQAVEQKCELDFPGLSSPFEQKSKEWKKLEKEVRDGEERRISQAGVLKSGQKVEATIGGCAHLNYEITFEGVKEQGTDALFAEMAMLLAQTPLRKDFVATWEEGLKKENRPKVKTVAKGQYDLPCGDATCRLDAQELPRVSLSYDLPL